jgi:hypothetical protein
MSAPAEALAAEHRFVERGEERWILLRALELLAKQVGGDSWEQVAAEAFTRAQNEYGK